MSRSFLNNETQELSYDTAISLLGIYPREMKNMSTHTKKIYSRAIHKSHKVEISQSPSIEDWTNKMRGGVLPP